MRNFHLRVIVDEINNLKNSINEVSFFHVFRERTYTTNASSKLGVQMAPDTGHIWAHHQVLIQDLSYHFSLIYRRVITYYRCDYIFFFL